MSVRRIALCVWLGVIGAGCSAPMNPSFDLSTKDAEAALQAMSRAPERLDRPLLILGGYLDTGIARYEMERILERVVDDDRMLGMAFAFMGDFDHCRDKLLTAVQASFPGNGGEPVEVDVVAYSMGGLVARHAARTDEFAAAQPLRIRRLFTIATPHSGAEMAWMPTDDLSADMMPGSAFLAALNAGADEVPYEVVAYGRLNDWIVGVEHAGYNGEPPYWVAPPPFSMGHINALSDPRIIADIVRRLRGEPAFTAVRPAPLP